jgi:peptidoglycan hydrolase CwlO-like protein
LSDSLLEVPAELESALATVRENRTRLEAAMVKRNAFDAEHAEAAARLAQATKTLSAEARLWADKLRAKAEKATPEQRTAVCLGHLSALPEGPRRDAYARLVELESSRPNAIRITVDE